MEELYLKLVGLAQETDGTTFIIGYSKRRNKHYITFTNLGKRIESEDINYVLKVAISLVTENRKKKENIITETYTMF